MEAEEATEEAETEMEEEAETEAEAETERERTEEGKHLLVVGVDLQRTVEQRWVLGV